MKVKVISLLCLFFTFSQAFIINGTCGIKRNDGTSEIFCCNFFQQTENGCVACKDGFQSFHGSMCKPCSDNSYGKRCLYRCSCVTNQRCDHIIGCIDLITTEDLYQGSRGNWTTITTTEPSGADCQNDNSSHLSIYLALGIGVIVIHIVLCIVCVFCYKKKRHINDIILSENAAMGTVANANIQGHAYDDWF